MTQTLVPPVFLCCDVSVLIWRHPVYPNPSLYCCISAPHAAASHLELLETYYSYIQKKKEEKNPKKNKPYDSYCVGALRAFLHLSPVILMKQASPHFWLLSLPSSMFHQSSILPFVLPLQSLFLWIFLSLFCASRFSASFQAGFKQLCETSKCPSLCRLFRKDDNDKPNPADLQLIALFHHPSTVILRPPPISQLFHLWLRCLDLQVSIFVQQGLRYSIINARLHLCIPQMSCFATFFLLWYSFPVSHTSS